MSSPPSSTTKVRSQDKGAWTHNMSGVGNNDGHEGIVHSHPQRAEVAPMINPQMNFRHSAPTSLTQFQHYSSSSNSWNQNSYAFLNSRPPLLPFPYSIPNSVPPNIWEPLGSPTVNPVIGKVDKQYSCMGTNPNGLNLSARPYPQAFPVRREPVQTEQDVTRNSNKATQPNVAYIGVFWDIENCSVPRGKSALTVVQRIREEFFKNYVEAEFICVCDIRKELSQVIHELNDAQVTVVHVHGTSKNAADEKLRQAMRRYADTYSLMTRPSNEDSFQYGKPAILLISGDVNFASDLSDLRYRKRMHVILLHNPQAPEALLACAHEHYVFQSILGGTPNRGGSNGVNGKTTNTNFGSDVSIFGLPPSPTAHHHKKLKQRLKRLSDNCGGKVIRISGHEAIIRFSSREVALRAAKRMDGENVVGSTIRAMVGNNIQMHSYEHPPLGLDSPPRAMTSFYPNSLPSRSNIRWPNFPRVLRPSCEAPEESQLENPIYEDELLNSCTEENINQLTLLAQKKIKMTCSNGQIASCKSEGTDSSGEVSTDSNGHPLEEPLVKSEVDSSSDSSTASFYPIGKSQRNILHLVVLEFEPFSSNLKSLLSTNKELPLSHLFESFNRKEDSILGKKESGVPLEHLILSVDGVETRCADTGERLVCLKEDRYDGSTYLNNISGLHHIQLASELKILLTNFDKACLKVSKFQEAYEDYFGKDFSVNSYGFDTLIDLFKKSQASTVHFIGDEPNLFITLTHDVQMKRFTVDMLRILKSRPGTKEVHFQEFGAIYREVCGREFIAENYGLCYLQDLIKELLSRTSLVTNLVQNDLNFGVKLVV